MAGLKRKGFNQDFACAPSLVSAQDHDWSHDGHDWQSAPSGWDEDRFLGNVFRFLALSEDGADAEAAAQSVPVRQLAQFEPRRLVS